MKYAAMAVVAPVFVSGCGGNGSSSQAPTMTGTWSFSGNSQSSIGHQYSGTASIQQTGSSITGSMPLSGSPCATQASISGSVADTDLNMQFNEDSITTGPERVIITVNLTGTLNSDYTSASGTYTSSGGAQMATKALGLRRSK